MSVQGEPVCMENTKKEKDKIIGPAANRVSFWLKVVYGIGQAPNAIKATLFGIFTLYFYTTVIGLSGTLVGVAVAIGLVWDAVIDPVIGNISDNAQGCLGKRHGFMMVGSAGMGISLWAYFSPPANLSTEALFFWLLVTNILVRTMTSIFSIPYYALGAELSRDYHDRTSVTGIRGIFALIGTLATSALSFVLFFPSTSQGVDPKFNLEGYGAMGLFAGLAMTLIGLISTFGTFSCRQYFSPGKAISMRNSVRIFFADLVLAVQNQSFRSLFISYSIFFLGTVINATLSIHFLTYYVEISESKALSTFHLSFYLGALAGVVFWMKISKIIEKRWLYFSGTLCTSMIMGCAFMLLGEGRIFGTGNLQPLLLGHGLAGFFASVLWIIPGSMIADIADQDELLTGKRREGIFFGIFHFGEQMAAGAAIIITGMLIDWFAGLMPGQVQQLPVTVTRIGMLYSLLPSILLAVASFFILSYSLDQNIIASIQSKLKKTHKQKKGQFESE